MFISGVRDMKLNAGLLNGQRLLLLVKPGVKTALSVSTTQFEQTHNST